MNRLAPVYLPRTRRARRLTATLVAALACALVALQAAQADDPLTRKQQQIEQQMKGAQAGLDDSSTALVAAQKALTTAQGRLKTANANLAAMNAQLASAIAQDRAMQAQLVTAQQHLQSAQAAVVTARARTTEQRDLIGRFAAQSYQGGSPQLMEVMTILQGGSAEEISGRLGVIDSVMVKQDSLYQEFQRIAADLAVKENEAKSAAAQVAEQKQATATAVARRQKLSDEAAAAQSTVAQLVKARAAAEAAAEQVRRHDAQKLAALKKQDAAIKAQILARKRSDANRSWSGSGMLLRPVNAPISSPYGWRIHPIYHYWGLHDGDDFAASCGQPQWAADSGTVISEYYSDVWGNRLYIDLGNINGHNYTVIHNHLSRYAVRVGQRVSRGQVVGYTGTTGWSTGCHLHFTVLRDGVAVNPAQYF